MCLCGRRSSQSDNRKSIKCSVETIFIPVENIQSPHSVTTYSRWDHFPMPLTNNAYFNDRTSCHNRCVSCLKPSNSFLKTEYKGASLSALPSEVGNNYKISLHIDWDCVSCELRLVCKYKFKNENGRSSKLSRRTIASMNSVLENLEENEKNYRAKEEYIKLVSELCDDEETEQLDVEIIAVRNTLTYEDEYSNQDEGLDEPCCCNVTSILWCVKRFVSLHFDNLIYNLFC